MLLLAKAGLQIEDDAVFDFALGSTIGELIAKPFIFCFQLLHLQKR